MSAFCLDWMDLGWWKPTYLHCVVVTKPDPRECLESSTQVIPWGEMVEQLSLGGKWVWAKFSSYQGLTVAQNIWNKVHRGLSKSFKP